MNQSALKCIILFYELAITKVIYIYFTQPCFNKGEYFGYNLYGT